MRGKDNLDLAIARIADKLLDHFTLEKLSFGN